MAWTAHELEKIGNADELHVASQRSDGSLRRYVTIWVVRDHDDLYVRSAYGRDAGWFRRAASSGKGAIRAAGIERHVRFEEPERSVDQRLNTAYRTKYRRYGRTYIDPMVGNAAAAATFKLVRRN
ncbi:MAG: DUF2255 family protein [Mycobacterium sp.]